jgi:site-specific DNA-methyltransferase (adenine-specific)
MHDADAVADHASRVRVNVEHAEALGRWPANVIHDGSDEVMEAFAAYGEKPGAFGNPRPKVGTAITSNLAVCNGGIKTGFNDTGTAARFFYCAKAGKADRARSRHPTVKPVALMRWLVRLVTPPGGVVLDPFAGSGTTGAAALAERRRAILVEREPEYIADIRRRLNGKPATAAAERARQRPAIDPEIRRVL